MPSRAENVGEVLPDESGLFRAFASPHDRELTPTICVAERCFQISKEKHPDGLSLGITPKHCVSGLKRNHGYCSMTAGTFHRLPYGLEARPDTVKPGHVIVVNYPFIDSDDDEERRVAQELSGRLCVMAAVESSQRFTPTSDD
jgi:hypothetical protein